MVLFHSSIRVAIVVLISFAIASSASAEVRKWTSAKSGKTIEAEYISADIKKKTITIKIKGKKKTVPIGAFSKADRKYVVNQIKMANKNKEVELMIKRNVTKFYSTLSKSEKEGLDEILSAGAKKTYQSNKTFFDQITTGDRGTQARVKKVEIDGKDASALTSLKFRGKYYDLHVGLKNEDSNWLVDSLTFETDGKKQKMDFATGQTVDPDAESADGSGNEFVANRGNDGYGRGGPQDGYGRDGYGRGGPEQDGYAAAGPGPKGRGPAPGPPPPNAGPGHGGPPPPRTEGRAQRPPMEDETQPDPDGYSRDGYDREGYDRQSADDDANDGGGYSQEDYERRAQEARQRAGGPPPGYYDNRDGKADEEQEHGQAGHGGGHGNVAATPTPSPWTGPPPFALPPQTAATDDFQTGDSHAGGSKYPPPRTYGDERLYPDEDVDDAQPVGHGHGHGHGNDRDPNTDPDRDASDLDK